MELDSNGYIHISYYDSINEDLKYATNKSGSWVVIVLDAFDNAGNYSSIEVDSADNIHIAYIARISGTSDDEVRYINNIGGSWNSPEVVEAIKIANYTDLDVDSNGNIYLCYQYTSDEYNSTLGSRDTGMRYVTNKSGVWEHHSLRIKYSRDTIGYWATLEVDSDGTVHASCYNTTLGRLEYFQFDS